MQTGCPHPGSLSGVEPEPEKKDKKGKEKKDKEKKEKKNERKSRSRKPDETPATAEPLAK